MRIDAVIFDFGVVLTECPYPFLEAIGAEMGAAPGQLLEAVLGPSTEDGDHPFHRLERGEIPLQQARDDILRRGRALYSLEVDIFQLFRQLPHGVHHEIVDRVKALKTEGYPTAMITNNIREFADSWPSMLPVPVEDLFDLVVDSSREGDPEAEPGHIPADSGAAGRARAGAHGVPG